MKNDKQKKNLDENEEKSDIIEEPEIVSEEDSENSTLQKKVEELEDQLKRTLADFQNREKRIIEERQEWIKSASRDLIIRLLPVLDTLILANQHDKSEGLNISAQQFLDVLKTEGVEPIKTEGKDFDPILMECVQTEEGKEGKVLEEIRSGYTLNEKVIRPALVKVGKENN
jgi:molecular chaperone GrpE